MDRPRPVTTSRSPTAPFSKVVPGSRARIAAALTASGGNIGVSWPPGVSMPAPGPAGLHSVFEGAFPALITTAAHVANEYIGRSVSGPRTEHHPGRGRSRSWCGRSGVPITWNGEVADLPAGCTDTTRRAAEGRERAEEPGTFVICGGIVSPGRTGKAWPASSARPCGTSRPGRAAGGSSRSGPPDPQTEDPLTPIGHVRALDPARRRSAGSLATHPLAAWRPDHRHRAPIRRP
jgi:hypothetical protein